LSNAIVVLHSGSLTKKRSHILDYRTLRIEWIKWPKRHWGAGKLICGTGSCKRNSSNFDRVPTRVVEVPHTQATGQHTHSAN